MSRDRRERRVISFSRNVYERLLAAYPKRFRELYGEEMVDVFEDECRERVHSGGRTELPWFWCKAIADLLGNAALERKGFSMRFSVVRWGGLLAAMGGMILAASGILMSWLLPSLTLSYAWYLASIGQMVGMLFLALSLTGLVALVARNGDSRTSRSRQGRPFNIRRLTRTQWSAVAGLFSVVVAALSALGLLATFSMYELIGVAGSSRPYPGDLENFLYPTFGFLTTFGLPLALILSGIAVWRSGALGRWSVLPVGVGVLTLLVPLTTMAVARVFWEGHLPQNSFFATFTMIGLPTLVIGTVWILLGLAIIRNENADRVLA